MSVRYRAQVELIIREHEAVFHLEGFPVVAVPARGPNDYCPAESPRPPLVSDTDLQLAGTVIARMLLSRIGPG